MVCYCMRHCASSHRTLSDVVCKWMNLDQKCERLSKFCHGLKLISCRGQCDKAKDFRGLLNRSLHDTDGCVLLWFGPSLLFYHVKKTLTSTSKMAQSPVISASSCIVFPVMPGTVPEKWVVADSWDILLRLSPLPTLMKRLPDCVIIEFQLPIKLQLDLATGSYKPSSNNYNLTTHFYRSVPV